MSEASKLADECERHEQNYPTAGLLRRCAAALRTQPGKPDREEVAREISRVVGSELSRAQCSNLADAILALATQPAPAPVAWRDIEAERLIVFMSLAMQTARDALKNTGRDQQALDAAQSSLEIMLGMEAEFANKRLRAAPSTHGAMREDQIEAAAKAMYEFAPWEDGTTWSTMPEAGKNAFRENMRFVFAALASLPADDRTES